MKSLGEDRKGNLLGICSKCRREIMDTDYDIGMLIPNSKKVIHVKCWLEEESEKRKAKKWLEKDDKL